MDVASNNSAQFFPTQMNVDGTDSYVWQQLEGNIGNSYTPPASLFAQLVQILGWANTTFNQVDLANCVCNNLCQFIQMLINIEGNSFLKEFIKDTAFNSASSNFQPTYLGCGNLYDEGKLVEFGDDIISIIDLMVNILKTLGVDDDAEQGEQLLTKLCLCLANAASTGTCVPGRSGVTAGNLSNINLDTSNNYACNIVDGYQSIIEAAESNPLFMAYNPNIVQYNSQIYRQQFFTMFVDLLQFVLFDRDCNSDSLSSDEGCCPPPSQENWLRARCRIGTGNGSKVVCSGVCAQWRNKDSFKPLVSSLLAVKHSIQLITLDRSDVKGQQSYSSQVASIYNQIVTDYYKLYKDSGASLTFQPDCAAPQFCCSTQLAADKCAYNCCTGKCENVAGCCLFPVPVIDTRKATYECGKGVPYLPSLGSSLANTLCFDLSNSTTSSEADADRPVPTTLQYDSFSNPCVIMPYCAAKVECNPACCEDDAGCNFLK
jgi:hypothetical protein